MVRLVAAGIVAATLSTYVIATAFIPPAPFVERIATENVSGQLPDGSLNIAIDFYGNRYSMDPYTRNKTGFPYPPNVPQNTLQVVAP